MTKVARFELIFYEMLGVRIFRHMVFKLETLVHLKDKGRNVNYHIKNYKTSSLQEFKKFLVYNATIHIRNISIFVIYAVYHYIFKRKFHWYDVFFLLLVIKDVYCVLLQRYNFLRICENQIRIKKKREEKIEKKAILLKAAFLERYDEGFKEKDRKVINDMKNKIQKGEQIVIGEQEIETLKRLSVIL